MTRILKWLDNYWYHYKWITIIVAFLLIVGIILTVQMIQKESYDAYIMYIGEEDIPKTQYQDILSSFEKVTGDHNKDSEVTINFARTRYISDKNDPMAGSVNAEVVQFMSTMIVQPYYIYLINADVYEQYKDKDLFVPVTSLIPKITEELLYDEQAVLFSKTVFASTNIGVDHLGDDTLLVIKNVPYSPSGSIVEAEKRSFNAHINVLENIISYHTRKDDKT